MPFTGCECDPRAKRMDRCSGQVVRCNGRLRALALAGFMGPKMQAAYENEEREAARSRGGEP
jgi:hypothetical protein